MTDTYAMIKPDAWAHRDAVMQAIAESGLTVVRFADMRLTEAIASTFYAEHVGRPFYPGLVAHMTSGPIRAMHLRGPDAVPAWRKLIGPTDSNKARAEAPQSLRARYGTDGTRNGFHGADAPASATREIGIIFPGGPAPVELTTVRIPEADTATAIAAAHSAGLHVLRVDPPASGAKRVVLFGPDAINRWRGAAPPGAPAAATTAQAEEELAGSVAAESAELAALGVPAGLDAALRALLAARGRGGGPSGGDFGLVRNPWRLLSAACSSLARAADDADPLGALCDGGRWVRGKRVYHFRDRVHLDLIGDDGHSLPCTYAVDIAGGRAPGIAAGQRAVHAMDIHPPGGDSVIRAIFELDGDLLRWEGAAGSRPQAFTAAHVNLVREGGNRNVDGSYVTGARVDPPTM